MYELQRMLQVAEARHEKTLLEQNGKYEKDIQFLMEQMRHLAEDSSRVTVLERDLCYYKSKTRKYKDQVESARDENKGKDSTSAPVERKAEGKEIQDCGEKKTNSSCGNERKNGSRDSNRESNRDSNRESNRESSRGGGGGGEEDFHLPNIRSHHHLTKKDSEKQLSEQQQQQHANNNAEEAKRLQEIFDSKAPQGKAPQSPQISHRSSTKRGSMKKKSSKEDAPQQQQQQQRSSNSSSVQPDSMEIIGGNPWNR